MACLSETYFTMDDRDWSEDGQEGEYFHIPSSANFLESLTANIFVVRQEMPTYDSWFAELAYNKAKTLLGSDVQFSEFGTRRRRSFDTQDIVVREIVRASKDLSGQGNFMGTSNVYFHSHIQKGYIFANY